MTLSPSVFIPETLDTVSAPEFFARFHEKYPSFAIEAAKIRARYEDVTSEFPEVTLLETETKSLPATARLIEGS